MHRGTVEKNANTSSRRSFLRKITVPLESGPWTVKTDLAQIEPYCANLTRGRLLQWCFNTSTLAHRCRQRASTPTVLVGCRLAAVTVVGAADCQAG